MTIRLSSGISSNYLPRATRYLESVKRFFLADGSGGVKPLMFAVDYPPSNRDLLGVPCQPLMFEQMRLQLPKRMMQNGQFVPFAPKDWLDDDVVIFTDADSYFQRAFSEAELAAFDAVAPGEFLADYNCPNHYQTLLSEAGDLFTKKPMSRIEELLPGMGGYECYNWGFVVARLSTWRELMERTTALWPTVDACFDNPARVQLACIYAANQPGMRISRLPPGCHAHGHHGVQTGLTKDNDVWRLNGEVVAFAHAL